MKTKRLKTLSEFFDQPMFEGDMWIYRGVANSEYDLIPSIGRLRAKDRRSLLTYEFNVFDQFKQKAVRYLSQEPRSDFEWLFLAQHYGIPTRLLDWTSNPLIALYFACEQCQDLEGAVYVGEIDLWYSLDEPPFAIKEVAGVRPRHTDLRYTNQDGLFTIHPDPTEPVNIPGTKLLVGPEAKEDLRWQLRKLGIRASLVFPGLDSVARDIILDNEGVLNGGLVRHVNLMREFDELRRNFVEEPGQPGASSGRLTPRA